MRKLFRNYVIVTMCLSCLFVSICWARETINGLQKKDYKLNEVQSFWVSFENWGKVQFTSFENGLRTFFYLADSQENIIYNFPETTVSTWITEKIDAISFKDIDRDNLKDVIVLGHYSSGVGNDGMIPFKYCTIYFQKGKKFLNIDEVDDIVNAKKGNLKDIKTIVKVTTANLAKIQKIIADEQKIRNK